VYEDDAGLYVNAVELRGLVRAGRLSFVKDERERKVLEDENGVEHVFERVAEEAIELDGYDPSTDRYVEAAEWLSE